MDDITSAPSGGISLDAEESAYLRGGRSPVAGSLLLSTSKYLNHPGLRDVVAQMGMKRDGQDVPSAYLIPDFNKAMHELTDYPKLFAEIDAERTRNPEFAQWLDARFVSDLQPEHVKDCAPGTLGHRVHDFISKSGMQIDFMYLGDPKTDYDYINKRRIQTHDILHMVTGLDPSPVGEIALIVANAASEVAYFGDDNLFGDLNRTGMYLAATSLMRLASHYPAALGALLEGFARGHALGSKQKKPLFMNNWEGYFDWQMEDIREEFSFQDGPADGAWEWTFKAATDPK